MIAEIGHPFGGPLLWIVDPFRILLVAAGLIIGLLGVRMMVNPTLRQYAKATASGIWACMALAFVAVVTEVAKIGYPVTWHLAFNVVGVIFAANYLRQLTALPEESHRSALSGRMQTPESLLSHVEAPPEPPVRSDDGSKWFVRFGVFLVLGAAVVSLGATAFSVQSVSKVNQNWDKAFVYHHENAQHICDILLKLEPNATCKVPPLQHAAR